VKHRLLLAAWLLLVWVALWRDVSIANVVSGVLVAAAAVWLFPPAAEREPLQVRPVAMARFIATSVWSIVRANFVVAWEVVTPTNEINEGVVAVQLASNHPVVITLVSHAIILAPGTMVIDIRVGDETRPTQLYVHVLHLRSVDAVRADVLQLEALALAAVSGSENRTPPITTNEGDPS
jgi:multicomponent Na+:H+ antiporter subunit E